MELYTQQEAIEELLSLGFALIAVDADLVLFGSPTYDAADPDAIPKVGIVPFSGGRVHKDLFDDAVALV